jgi:hypothetical protein
MRPRNTSLPLGFHQRPQYRTVSEALILDMCHVAGWACERSENSPGMAITCEALKSWIGMGLEFRLGTDGVRYFDPVEVLNFMKLAGLDGRQAFWTEHVVGTARRLVRTMDSEDPRNFTVELRRMFNTRSLAAGTALRLRMPLPLTSDHLGNLDVRPHAVESSSIETDVAVSRGRLEVRAQASSSDEMTIGATATFTAVPRDPGREPPRSDLSAPDPRYLRQRDGLIVVSNRIAALASSLAGPGDDPLAAIRAFWNYCLDEFFQGAVHYDQVDLDAPGDWLLDSGWGDCQLVAAVFASMCRARGIPARILGGFYLYKARPTEHFWAEAWIDGQGWTPFDFGCWELSRGGCDIEWRDHFFGRIDARLTNQCFPFEFTGAIGVKIPAAWQVVQSMEPDGASVALLDVTGSLVYRDFVSITG